MQVGKATAAPRRHQLRVGLTGGIGSGKSTVAALLAAHGAAVIDTDAIARQITQAGGLAIKPLKQVFGAEFIDGSGALDRARMRKLAFTDVRARARLESILHPLIGQETERLAFAAPAGSLVFDVPLLTESAHWRWRVDLVLVVDCLADTQVQRVMARSDWTRDAVTSVIGQQASRKRRRAGADAVIFNDGLSREQLAAEVAGLARRWGIKAPV
jgi:dephospho-CoA kinase